MPAGFSPLFLMNTSKQQLTDQLAAAAAPHLSNPAGGPPKPVAKTLRQLAKQLTQQQAKSAKADRPVSATGKQARKALVGELVTVLTPYLDAARAGEEETTKGVLKTVKRLAAQLVKQRRKQARQTAKLTKKAEKQAAKQPNQPRQATAPVTKAAPRAKAACPQAARPAATPAKHPASKAANAPAPAVMEAAPAK